MMQSVGSDYHYGSDLIGHGAFAIVYKGWHKPSGKTVAIKQILLKNIPNKLSSMRQKEISILKELRHPNIVQLYDCYETRVELYIIMEFCNGGDLADYLQVKKTLSEDSIRHLSIHIASALVFIHQHHIIHRDIKPQNILLSFANSSSNPKQFKEASIKIADFGFARYLYEADMAATVCGSPIYMAPEVLIGHKYDSKVDMWSTGVILYQCLTGNTPFQANDPHSLRKQYIRNTLKPRIPMGVSPFLTDLLLKLIVKSPQDRMSQVEFKSHSFLKSQLTSPEETLSVESSPSRHTRSSPVPINRPNTNNDNNSSSRNSPQSGRHSCGSLKGFSASSGPPSIHRIVTNPSLHKFYSSPPTNVTDEGFILVGTPGAKHHVSSSPCSIEAISIGSSSKSSTSPIGSLPRHSYLVQSPHSVTSSPRTPTTPDPLGPLSSGVQGPSLSHTPPFSSLFRTSSGQLSGMRQQQQQHHGSSPDTNPQLIQNYFSSSPGKHSLSGSRPSSLPGSHPGSLPGSRPGSQTKLSTLVESKHEEFGGRGGGGSREHDNHPVMVDSMGMITPSLLMESDVLRDELDRLSTGATEGGNMFNLLKSFPTKEDTEVEDSIKNMKKFSKGLDLSQELADIRKRNMSLSQKRLALFNIGDSTNSDKDSPSVDSSEILFDKWNYKGIRRGSSSDNSPSSPVGPEEVFSLQLEEGNQDKPLQSLQKNIVLANELLRIAKTRQGPMLLLSSSMGDSGGMVDHVVRFSEQLVLCAKAASVVRDSIRQYLISHAVSSTDPLASNNEVLEDAYKLELLCLDKARLAKDLYHKCLAKRRRHSLPHVSVTAEKLIFFQAVDLCKQALLEERQHRRDDCLKKYRLAGTLLNLLLSDANSPNDRSLLKKYIDLVRYRQRTLATE